MKILICHNFNMVFDPRIHHRRSIRLKGYDYSQEGYYFITLCVKDRRAILGKIQGEKMILNCYGEIVRRCWDDLPNYYINCKLDEFIIMPDHFHGILVIGAVLNPPVRRIWKIREIPPVRRIWKIREIPPVRRIWKIREIPPVRRIEIKNITLYQK